MDMTPLIGFPLEEAEDILLEEELHYTIKFTCTPRTKSKDDSDNIRVIGIRPLNEGIELISASINWESE